MNIIVVLSSRLKYLYRWVRFRHGFGVHSPYAFSFINNVIEEKSQYYGYEDIVTKIAQHKIRPDFTKKYPRKYYQLLFRISHFFKPKRIILLGHESGECLLYLKSTLADVSCILIETDKGRLEATECMLQQECNVTLLQSESIHLPAIVERLMKEPGQNDIFYFHASIDLKTKQKAIQCCLERKSQIPLMFIIDYIEGDADAEEFWSWVKAKEEISITFDLMRLGVAVYHPKLKKQDYKLAF